MGRITLTNRDGKTIFDGDSTQLIQEIYGMKPKQAVIEWRKYRVYGGPHHGRFVELPAFLSAVVLPGFGLPEGERFSSGRTHPEQWKGTCSLYKVTEVQRHGSDLAFGELYLADQGTVTLPVSSGMYRVPPIPGILVSDRAHQMLSLLNSVSAEVGAAFSNAQQQAAIAKRTPYLKAVYQYISELESKLGVSGPIVNVNPK